MPKSLTKTMVAATAACTLVTAAQAAMTISNAKTRSVSCSGGVCTPTGGNANLNTDELVAMLASTDVTLKSDASTVAIGILDPLTWASTHRLTLDAYESVHVRAPVVVEGTAGVAIVTNDGGTGGDYTFNTTTAGAITFWDTASSLTINGKTFALVKDIKTLASNIASHPTRAYALAADYDASADGTYNTSVIATVFTGALEGLGHSITHLDMAMRESTGGALLAQVGTGGVVRDIGVTDANVQGASGKIAALAVQNDGHITHAFSTGAITGRQLGTLGGLVAVNTGRIVQSSSAANIASNGVATLGGLVGEMNGGSIELSHATGSVQDNVGGTVGGLVGGVFSGNVIASFATGTVDGGVTRAYHNVMAGGLVGMNKGNILQSFAAGATANYNSPAQRGSCCLGDSYLGELVGDNQGTIRNGYATGSVKLNFLGEGNDASGGLVGRNTGVISTTYSTGLVSDARGGGLLGTDAQTTRTSYWDLDTSGITDPGQGAGTPRNDPGITGLTDTQLKAGLPAGFRPNVWGQDANINNGWPYLLANPPQ